MSKQPTAMSLDCPPASPAKSPQPKPESTDAKLIMRKMEFVGLGTSRRTHIFMAATYSLLLVATVWGLWTRSATGWQIIAEAAAVMIPISLLPAILYHDRKLYDQRNAALSLPWVFLLIAIIPPMAVLSVRFEFPLRDDLFAKMDRLVGVSVPEIAAWITAHPAIRAISDRSYDALYLLLPAAMLLPAVLGKRRAAEEFIVSNATTFLISFPLFTLLPGIGPWVGSHFLATESQRACEATVIALHGGTQTAAVVGIVCFPSFHVIWAVLSAYSLWSIRILRIPACVLSVLVVASTITTGWHYFVDVVAGILVAALSLAVACWIVRPESQLMHCEGPSEEPFHPDAIRIGPYEGREKRTSSAMPQPRGLNLDADS
jgi:membrane-associated phospholipid phosphatase